MNRSLRWDGALDFVEPAGAADGQAGVGRGAEGFERLGHAGAEEEELHVLSAGS